MTTAQKPGKQASPMKNELIDLLCKKSFQFSEEPVFKLASGQTSHYYINCKPVTLSSRGLYLIGHLVFDALKDRCIEAVGGMTFGADPIAVAASLTSETRGAPFAAFSIRKTQKDHGIVKWIEGDLSAGQRVAIIEDVATTGGSSLKAIERARSEGLIVDSVVLLVDRQEGGAENIQKAVPEVRSIVTRTELLAAYRGGQ
ncbi:MAG: orotate phosphoribosyltransferase [Desulfosalsimonas sp.]